MSTGGGAFSIVVPTLFVLLALAGIGFVIGYINDELKTQGRWDRPSTAAAGSRGRTSRTTR